MNLLINAPFEQRSDGHVVFTGAICNLPAVLIVLAMSAVCYVGMRQSAGANTFMVSLKVGIIVLFIVAGLGYLTPAYWSPYVPPNTGTFGHFGWSGVLQGAAIIFFSYVGFDTASTTALEARNPQRDLPLGILGALAISAVLYVGMSTVITGMVPFTQLNVDAPVAVALDAHPQLAWLGYFVKVGAIAGMTSVILTSLLGQPRILLAMADDGLLPPAMSRCHPRFRTPHVATAWTGIGAALIAGVFPLDMLADLISIGILLAFAVVCIGVLVMRHTRPEVKRPFRVPWAPFTCVLGALVCVGMTYFLADRHLDPTADLDGDRLHDLRLLRLSSQPPAQEMTRTLTSTPLEDGFWMPAEFAIHAGCWLLWPERPDNWREAARPAQRAFACVAAAIASFEPVTIGASRACYESARAMLPESVRLVELSHDDSWMRDVGPTFVVNDRNEVRGVDWHFNAWGGFEGGLYSPWDQDDLVARKVLEIEGVRPLSRANRERRRCDSRRRPGNRARHGGVSAQRQPQSAPEPRAARDLTCIATSVSAGSSGWAAACSTTRRMATSTIWRVSSGPPRFVSPGPTMCEIPSTSSRMMRGRDSTMRATRAGGASACTSCRCRDPERSRQERRGASFRARVPGHGSQESGSRQATSISTWPMALW